MPPPMDVPMRDSEYARENGGRRSMSPGAGRGYVVSPCAAAFVDFVAWIVKDATEMMGTRTRGTISMFRGWRAKLTCATLRKPLAKSAG